MNLEQAFETFLQENQLIAPTDRILVAVSGGVDSMVLAHLVRQSNQKFGIAHCNFRLRGAASDADEQFVRDLANAWEVPVYIHHFDTKKYAEENGISVQMAARELRYTWFEIIRESADFTHIATGHNLNDSVETCLLNLMRGTGITGLGGIPVQNGHVIRPLLFATRESHPGLCTRKKYPVAGRQQQRQRRLYPQCNPPACVAETYGPQSSLPDRGVNYNAAFAGCR